MALDKAMTAMSYIVFDLRTDHVVVQDRFDQRLNLVDLIRADALFVCDVKHRIEKFAKRAIAEDSPYSL